MADILAIWKDYDLVDEVLVHVKQHKCPDEFTISFENCEIEDYRLIIEDEHKRKFTEIKTKIQSKRKDEEEVFE